jgi:hypothetical protein
VHYTTRNILIIALHIYSTRKILIIALHIYSTRNILIIALHQAIGNATYPKGFDQKVLNFSGGESSRTHNYMGCPERNSLVTCTSAECVSQFLGR